MTECRFFIFDSSVQRYDSTHYFFPHSKVFSHPFNFQTLYRAKIDSLNLSYCFVFLDFRFGKFVKNYKEETKRNLTYKDLAGTETETPNECMLLLEMTRKNQEKVLASN